MLLAGCLAPTTTKTRVKPADSGRRGVEVIVHEDGTLMLYGNPIDREKLADRLIDEESADKGRAVELKAKGDVRRKELVELRDYLVAHKIPNVVIVTQRNATAYESGAKTSQPPSPDGAARGPLPTPPRKRTGGPAPASAP
jgi:hypothetical protein